MFLLKGIVRAFAAPVFCLAFIIPSGLHGAELNHPGAAPHWSSDQVREAAGDRSGPEIIVRYHVTDDPIGVPGENIDDGEKPDASYPAKAEDIEIRIGERYVVWRVGETNTLYDFELQRILSWNENEKEFLNRSMYALPGFIVFEARNRKFLLDVLGKGGVEIPAANQQVWAETSLGVPLPDMPKLEIMSRTTEDGAHIFWGLYT